MSKYNFGGERLLAQYKMGLLRHKAQNNKPPQIFLPAQILRGEAFWPPSPFPPKKLFLVSSCATKDNHVLYSSVRIKIQ
jgi:hypothetical protein